MSTTANDSGPRLERLLDPQTGQPVHLVYAIPPELLQGASGCDGRMPIEDLWHQVWKRRLLVLAITVVSALASAVFALLQPNLYTATLTALPPPDKSGGGLLSQAAGLAAIAGVSLPAAPTSTTDTAVAILNSRALQETLVSEFELKAVYGHEGGRDALLRRFRELWTARADKKAGTIAISFTDRDPARAAAVANRAGELLGRMFTEVQQGDAKRERVFFEGRIAKAQKDQETALARLTEFQRENQAVEIQAQTQATVEALGTLQGQLISEQIELRALRAVSAGEDSPQVRLLDERIRGLEVEISRLLGTTSDGALIGLGRIPVLGQEYLALVREAKRQEALLAGLLAQYEGARVGEAREARAVSIIDPAVVPDQNSGPRRGRIVSGVTVIALIASMCIVLLSGLLKRSRG